MATIKYKGMELEEITEPQIFDPPKKMVVADGQNSPRTAIVTAILAFLFMVYCQARFTASVKSSFSTCE